MPHDETTAYVLSELNRLKADLEANQRILCATRRQIAVVRNRLRATWALGSLIAMAACVLAASPEAQAQFGVTLASLNARLSVVENKTAPLTHDAAGKLLTVQGVNVRIIDGTGLTDSSSGLGNLQVGYNQLRGSGDVRSGSHNLILGDRNNYSGFGGLVSGYINELSGNYSGILGGFVNTASGLYSATLGGSTNVASGPSSSVSGGAQNVASGVYSTVSGGGLNQATSLYATVSGGLNRSATQPYNWVGGNLSSPD